MLTLEERYNRNKYVEAGNFKKLGIHLLMIIPLKWTPEVPAGSWLLHFWESSTSWWATLPSLLRENLKEASCFRIINDPSEHNLSNYRCSVIMLMLIHKGLLFAQHVLCTLSLYLTNSVFSLQLWFACHVKWCLHLWACQDTSIKVQVLFPLPSQDCLAGFFQKGWKEGKVTKKWKNGTY